MANDVDGKAVRVWHKHSLLLRWMHWLNFPLISIMILSGVYIYWANYAYTPFIPRDWFKTIHADHRLAFGMELHFFFMWIFLVNGILYVSYMLIGGGWRELLPNVKSFREAAIVFLHDLGFKIALPPQGKFNAAQRFAYSGVIALGALQILTGFAIYKPVQLQWLTTLFGGYAGARLVHFIVTVLFILFFFVHVAQVVRAGWNNFQSMITGLEREDSGSGS